MHAASSVVGCHHVRIDRISELHRSVDDIHYGGQVGGRRPW